MLRVYAVADCSVPVTLCDICKWRRKLTPEDALVGAFPGPACTGCGEANAAYQASEPGPVEKQLEKLKAQAEDDRTACPVCRRGPHARWIVGPPYKPCAYCGLDGPGPWPELPITSPRAIVDRAALHLPLGWGDTRSEAAQ